MEYCTKYMDHIFMDEFCQLASKEYIQDKEVSVLTVKNATILPFVSSVENPSKGYGGVLDENDKYINISSTPEEELMVSGYEVSEKAPFHNERVIYLGYFIKQWGHFLVDFLPRFWWLIDNYKGEKVVILARNTDVKFDGNFYEMMELFGITHEKIHILKKCERYSEVVIPEMSMIRPVYYSKECKDLFCFITESLLKGTSIKEYDKIYFTRSKLKKARMTEIGEKHIEKIFAKNGYKVIAPEKCSLKELVFYLNHCKSFASLSGTIPHNVLFCKPSTECIIINKTYRINTIQLLLNEISGVNTVYIDSNICIFPASPGSGPFWMRVETNLINYAKDRAFSIPKKYTNPNRLVAYLTGIEKGRELQKFVKMYCRLRDQNLDIGGAIIGAARPDMNFEDKKIYYHYREKIGYMNSDTNFISFATNLYHYLKRGAS